MSKLTGSQIFIKTLQDLDVEVMFGYPGGAVLNLYDEIYKQDKIKHIRVRHEQGAVHMADGYARVTRKVGVALVTSGPGATNAVTGIATAYMDSVPMVVFTGQVHVDLIGNDAFQEVDIVGITRPCTKHNFLVKEAKDLERIIKEAFYIAKTGRPGPVLVDIPKDTSSGFAEYKNIKDVNLKGYKPPYSGHIKQIEKALDTILNSKKPLLYVGGGVVSADASDLLRKFAEKLNIPVALTLMGLGGFPGTHPLSLGMLGMHGGYWANMAVHSCDLLIALGPRFDDRVTGNPKLFASDAKKIHLDIDAASIGKNVAVDIPIVGDAKDVLKKFLGLIDKNSKVKAFHDSLAPWHNEIQRWREEHPLKYKQDPNGAIKPQFVMEKIYEVTGGKGIITTDVGQHQMWAAQFYKLDVPRHWCTSGGLGTMGYGFPAAIGCQVAYPNETVFCISGDGSIQMNIQEIATAVQYNLPVKVAIINNYRLGMVKQWQEYFYGRRFSESVFEKHPDFVKLAESYGALGLIAKNPGDVTKVLKRAIEHNGPVLIDFHVDPCENVLPMVPAGKRVHEMMLV